MREAIVAVWYFDRRGRQRMAKRVTAAYRRACRRTRYAQGQGALIFPIKWKGTFMLKARSENTQSGNRE